MPRFATIHTSRSSAERTASRDAVGTRRSNGDSKSLSSCDHATKPALIGRNRATHKHATRNGRHTTCNGQPTTRRDVKCNTWTPGGGRCTQHATCQTTPRNVPHAACNMGMGRATHASRSIPASPRTPMLHGPGDGGSAHSATTGSAGSRALCILVCLSVSRPRIAPRSRCSDQLAACDQRALHAAWRTACGMATPRAWRVNEACGRSRSSSAFAASS